MAATNFTDQITVINTNWLNDVDASIYEQTGVGKTTVASATTPDIFAATVGNLIDYTGTTTCTGFVAAVSAGSHRTLYCAGAAVFTAGANLLIDGVASGSNLTCVAGDVLEVVAITTTQWKITKKSAIGPIRFPVTQNASSDANTLDDYEEGTWTVTPSNLTVVGTPTYYGRYTKIGRMVHINVTLSATTSTASTATATYVDLPFAAENSVSNRWVCSVCGYDLTSYGNGLLRNTSALYLPTWAATATNIQISCSYMAVD